MANSFVISRNYGQNLAPGTVPVKLAANVVADMGNMIVVVAGYGEIPAAANQATGNMAGLVIQPADNTGGAAGDVTAVCVPDTAAFANDGTHPCTQADVGNIVFASSATTISRDSADGPPAGKLLAYNTSDIQGRPCLVALNCMV